MNGCIKLCALILAMFLLVSCTNVKTPGNVPGITDMSGKTEISPETTAPETTAPETTVPETTAPETTAPEATVPVITEPEEIEPEGIMVPILMFHDLKRESGGTWSMSADNFKTCVEYILGQGFTPITFRQLAAYVDGYGELPAKPVCLTFDDGYYSNYELLLPIVTELQVPVTVFMTCGTVRSDDEIPDPNSNWLYKMNLSEIDTLEASRFVDVQSHTWGMHGLNTNYSETQRDNSMPLEGETKEEYQAFFSQDCDAAWQVLHSAGVWSEVVFSYPSGKHNPWAEEVLKARGYRASLTTDYSHRNWVVKGCRDSIFLLGRMNVNDETTMDSLMYYMNRK